MFENSNIGFDVFESLLYKDSEAKLKHEKWTRSLTKAEVEVKNKSMFSYFLTFNILFILCRDPLKLIIKRGIRFIILFSLLSIIFSLNEISLLLVQENILSILILDLY